MPCAHAGFSVISLIQYVFCLYDGRVQLLPVQVPEILFLASCMQACTNADVAILLL